MQKPHPLFTQYLDKSWCELLHDLIIQPQMTNMAIDIDSQYQQKIPIYPPQEQIFNAFNLLPFEDVKVVIVGQDPYHGEGQAHGLSFSVPKGVALPPSLRNICKELNADLGIPYPPPHGCLVSWEKQGVLLLNATLTVEAGSPLSHHGNGWEYFTDGVIQKLSERSDPVIFVLWGKSAQDKCRFLRKRVDHDFILIAPHPSPLSARRGFFGCNHFSKINNLLIELNKPPINWELQAAGH